MGLSANRFAACIAALMTAMLAHAADLDTVLLSSTAGASPGGAS
jgi:hypothetical protein